jgi:hypothetical protein
MYTDQSNMIYKMQFQYNYFPQQEIVSFNPAPGMNPNARPITKSFNKNIVPITSNNLEINVDQSHNAYNYNYNIWEASRHRYNSESSSASSTALSSPRSSVDVSPSSINNLFNRKKRELPSHKIGEQKELINLKCMERSKKLQSSNKCLICTFCKNNNEPEHIYKSHVLKDIYGRTSCPVLKLYKCPVCHLSGDDAHTITYCKKFKNMRINDMLH